MAALNIDASALMSNVRQEVLPVYGKLPRDMCVKNLVLGTLCLFLHGVKFLVKSKFRKVTGCFQILGLS